MSGASLSQAPRRSAQLGFWPAAGTLFALAYSQAPLYTSNQNQYFLHGLAAAGYGHLAQDWLATTLDPTPVFSWLVQATYGPIGAWFFYVEYGILLAAALWGAVVIGESLLPRQRTAARRILLVAAIALSFSEGLRFLISRLPWSDGGYLLEGGLAGQRLLGPVFEPSAFGSLLLVSIALFLRRRPAAAALAAAAAAVVHPTYLLTAGTLVAAYVGILWYADGKRRAALTSGALALVAVVPILYHTVRVFGLASTQVANDAARVLVDVRIPHHAIVAQWLDPSAAIKLGLILGAMLLVRRTRLVPIMLTPALAGLVLSAVQLATGSDRLALLFPWRVSALLVPLSTVVILAKGLTWSFQRLDHRGLRLPGWVAPGAWIGLAILALAGTASFALHIQNQQADPERALFDEVRRMSGAGQVYLIPPKHQDFRLATGQPAFVDFKAIPYAPAEVLQWYDRLRLAQFFYRDDPAQIDCHLLDRAASAGVTHVVLEQAQFGIDCERLHKLWGDSTFEIDQLAP